jgi:hypothetical protein
MLCASASIFILANSYETAFSQTLPLVHAVAKVDLSFIQPDPATTVNKMAMQTNSFYEGNYGAPLQLKVSDNKVRIPVAGAIYNHSGWLARASTSHYIIVSPAKTGDIGDMVIYMVGGKTTIPDVSQIKAGSNIYVDTKRDWRYFYRVDETAVLTDPLEKYILPSTSSDRLYVVVEQGSTHGIIAATLTNVQNANQ